LPDGKLLSTFRGFTHLVRSVAFSSDGLYVAAGEMGQVKAWRVGSNPERIVIDAPAGDFAGTPIWHGSRVALVGRKGGLQIWDRDKGGTQATILVPGSEVVDQTVFSPDGQRLAAGMADGSIRLFAVDSGRLLQTLPGSPEKVAGLAITPDGTLLAAAVGKEVVLWRLADGVKLKTLPTVWMQRRALAIAPDGRRLAATGTASFEVWELPSGRLVFTGAHERTVGCLAFSRDSRTVACGEDFHAGGRIKLWDATDGKLLGTLQGHKGNVSALAFAPDGSTLASGGSSVSSDGSTFEGEVRLWDPVIGQERATLMGANHMVTQLWFAADGKSLTATDIEGRSVIWQAADPAEATGLHPHDRLFQPTVEDFQRQGIPLKKP
jgi:WD40 repeat protein